MNFDKIFLVWANLMKKYTSLMIGWKNNLEKVVNENKKLIVIFWHPLCIPCKKIFIKVPVIFVFYKFKGYTLKFCNLKDNNEHCEKYNINTTPTMIIFENGKEVKRYEDEEVLKNLYKI